MPHIPFALFAPILLVLLSPMAVSADELAEKIASRDESLRLLSEHVEKVKTATEEEANANKEVGEKTSSVGEKEKEFAKANQAVESANRQIETVENIVKSDVAAVKTNAAALLQSLKKTLVELEAVLRQATTARESAEKLLTEAQSQLKEKSAARSQAISALAEATTKYQEEEKALVAFQQATGASTPTVDAPKDGGDERKTPKLKLNEKQAKLIQKIKELPGEAKAKFKPLWTTTKAGNPNSSRFNQLADSIEKSMQGTEGAGNPFNEIFNIVNEMTFGGDEPHKAAYEEIDGILKDVTESLPEPEAPKTELAQVFAESDKANLIAEYAHANAHGNVAKYDTRFRSNAQDMIEALSKWINSDTTDAVVLFNGVWGDLKKIAADSDGDGFDHWRTFWEHLAQENKGLVPSKKLTVDQNKAILRTWKAGLEKAIKLLEVKLNQIQSTAPPGGVGGRGGSSAGQGGGTGSGSSLAAVRHERIVSHILRGQSRRSYRIDRVQLRR